MFYCFLVYAFHKQYTAYACKVGSITLYLLITYTILYNIQLIYMYVLALSCNSIIIYSKALVAKLLKRSDQILRQGHVQILKFGNGA